MADEETEPVQLEQKKNAPQLDAAQKSAMYPVPANYSAVMPRSSSRDKRPEPSQAGSSRPMYNMPMSHHGKYPVPYMQGPYVRHPMGANQLTNQYATGSGGAASMPTKAASNAPQLTAERQIAKQTRQIIGEKRPTLVNARTPMDTVQPKFSSRPPRWTDTEVNT